MKNLSECKILLVDDIKTNINILVEALKGQYKLGFALEGASALKFARTQKPDLILLDVMMPGMDGFEVCRKLKESPETEGIPVLFVTAMDDAVNKTTGFEAGAVDYITKPFDMAEVKARVKTHLELKIANEELKRRHDRMQHSLDLAMEVQQSLLPRKAPEIPGLDLAGKSLYCDETGGDYYDFLRCGVHPDSTIGLVVGDVSEHGVQSALLMASARAFLRQRFTLGGTLTDIITDVNRQFSQDVEDSGRFITVFLSRIDMETRKMKWIRAGHDPALIYNPATDEFTELIDGGLPVGVTPYSKFVEYEARLEPGDIFIIGTDGIWEAHDQAKTQFGKERFKKIIRKSAHESAETICDAVINAVNDYRGAVPQEDDVTLLVARML